VQIVMETKLPVKLFRKGKVRDVYDLDDYLLIVATDRISAFDVIMPNGIPSKGQILNMISAFWFSLTKDIVANHVVTTDVNEIVAKFPVLKGSEEILFGRTLLAKKTQLIKIECVVRGYLAGSGWKEYKEKGSICGRKMPEGLKESQRIPFPIFTPSTKADEGHDMNISEQEMMNVVGEKIGNEIKEESLIVYEKAREYAEKKGIIIADTKFEFGMLDGKIILIDEILTPDSSRFWSQKNYVPGRSQDSFDKQYVRDYLESLIWDKTPPAPPLPDEIVRRTREKYVEAYEIITGKKFEIS